MHYQAVYKLIINPNFTNMLIYFKSKHPLTANQEAVMVHFYLELRCLEKQ